MLTPSTVPTPVEREATIERLTRSFADDTLTMDEFERRAAAVYAALTVSDLHALVADLPAVVAVVPGVAGGNTAVAVPDSGAIRTVLGNTERRGTMRVPRLWRVRNLFGNTELDLTHATFAPGVTEIHVKTLFGNVEVTVPEGVRVELSCGAVLASVASHVNDPVGRDSPSDIIVRITGRAVFSNVEAWGVSRTERIRGES